MDVEVAARRGAFRPWLTATPSTSEAFAARPGECYRFRARATDALDNASAYVETGSIFAAPSRSGGRKPSPRLRLVSATIRDSQLTVRGTISCGARRPVRLIFLHLGTTRNRPKATVVNPKSGHISATLRLPRRSRRGSAGLSYPGDRYHRGERVTGRVNSAPSARRATSSPLAWPF